MIYHPSIHISAPEDNYLLSPADAVIGEYISGDEAEQLAYRLAFCGLGHVAPNPLVGCVLVGADGRLLGRGAHHGYGDKHAEVVAIEDALQNFPAAKLRGATMYVTLQPCDHHGKTPPCTDLIIRYQMARVVYGLPDPNPSVDSLNTLQRHGIAVQQGEFNRDIDWLDEAYFWQQDRQAKRPYVALKIATTRTGLYGYEGQGRHWLTNARARRYGHYLRQRYDAVLIGRQTLESDNPALNVRLELRVSSLRNPYKVILAHPDKLNALENLQVLRHEPEKTIFVAPAGSSVSTKASRLIANILMVSADANGYNLLELLEKLREKLGVMSLLVEGGGKVWQSFYSAGLVDKVHLFQANSEAQGAGALYWHWRQKTKLSSANLTATRLIWLDSDRLYEGSLPLHN